MTEPVLNTRIKAPGPFHLLYGGGGGQLLLRALSVVFSVTREQELQINKK